MDVLQAPSLPQVASFLQAHLAEVGSGGRGLLLVGRMRVDYDGRAKSRLAAGDRVVIVKADGTLLIHNPEGMKPVNWQPPGCSFTVNAKDGACVLQAERTKPSERVDIGLERVDLVGLLRLETSGPLELSGSEADLREVVRAHPELVEPGFVPWSKERQTERGPMDLYGEDSQGRRIVVELKRVRAGLGEATQLWRYVEKERSKRGVIVRGILMAPGISERALLLLQEHGLEYREANLIKARQRTRAEKSLAAF